MITLPFEIRPSKIEGLGAFANRTIQKGERICSMRGKKRSFAWFEKYHLNKDQRISCDHLQIGIRTYILLDDPYFRINHSCEPNAGIRGKWTLSAMRTIQAGEEITYDYSTTEWTPPDYPAYYVDGWPMSCKCGAKHCRKSIGCFPYLPESLKRKYIESGIIQDFIAKKSEQPIEKNRCIICERLLRKQFLRHTRRSA
ncbi:MAG: SET domain-containing protein [Candidatus Paceibacterota bacterium]